MDHELLDPGLNLVEEPDDLARVLPGRQHPLARRLEIRGRLGLPQERLELLLRLGEVMEREPEDCDALRISDGRELADRKPGST